MPTHENLPVVGVDAYLGLNQGTHSAPTWLEIKNAIDVERSDEDEQVEASSRLSRHKMYRQGQTDSELTFGYRYYGGADPVFASLLEAKANRTPIELCVLDGPPEVAGNKGWRCYYAIFSMPLTQELNGAQEFSFTLKPTPYFEDGVLIEPSWMET